MGTIELEKPGAAAKLPRFETPRPRYREDIQGLRAIAVLLVVLYHADFSFSGGFVGVDVFFVLSGFVITRGLLWEAENNGAIDLPKFFKRRVARIVPASVFMSVIVFVTIPFLGPLTRQAESIESGVAAALFNANHYFSFWRNGSGGLANYFDPNTELNPFLHMWSLSVEEQFYIFFPLFVFLIVKKSTPDAVRRRLLTGIVTVMAISLVAALVYVQRSQLYAFYLAPLRAWEFLVGAALVWAEPKRLSRSITIPLAAVGLPVLFASALFFHEGNEFPGWRALVPVGATAALIASGASDNSVKQALSNPTLGFIGRVSYAWYLWHWPLLVFARATLPGSTLALVGAVLISFVIAVASTFLLEEPLRHSAWIKERAPKFVLVTITLSFVAAAIGMTINQTSTSTDEIASFEETFRRFTGETETCLTINTAPAGCESLNAVSDDGQDVVLLGDSTALQLYDGMRIVSEQERLDLRLAYRSLCPSNRFETLSFGVEHRACGELWDTVTEEMRTDPPDVVMVAISLDAYIKSTNVELRNDGGAWQQDEAIRSQIVSDGVTEAIGELSEIVDRVVYVGVTPTFGSWRPQECSYALWTLNSSSCAPDPLDSQEIEANRSRSNPIEDRIRSLDGVEFVDLDDALCPNSLCGPWIDGQWVFSDSSHITADQSERLVPLLAEAVRDDDRPPSAIASTSTESNN